MANIKSLANKGRRSPPPYQDGSGWQSVGCPRLSLDFAGGSSGLKWNGFCHAKFSDPAWGKVDGWASSLSGHIWVAWVGCLGQICHVSMFLKQLFTSVKTNYIMLCFKNQKSKQHLIDAK